jgi:hypothetical protein
MTNPPKTGWTQAEAPRTATALLNKNQQGIRLEEANGLFVEIDLVLHIEISSSR